MSAGEQEPAGIRVYLLGRFVVVVGGREVPNGGWRRRKARQLFKCLLTRPRRRILKAQAVELFWPESDPGAADTNLRSAIYAIRLALGATAGDDDPLVVDRDTIGLRADAHIWTDADQFERAIGEAQDVADPLPLLEEADALYAGDYLPDDLYEDWAAERREALKRAWAGLQVALAGARERAGDREQAGDPLRRLLAADPCDEHAARELIRLLRRQGRQAEAQRVYQQLVRSLRDELDADPAPETVELARQADQSDEASAGTGGPGGRAADPGARAAGRRPAERPTGTATFLFTDIEGSTELWERAPVAMHAALDRHDALVRAAIEAAGGHVFKAMGDSFCAAFADSSDALAAALEAQRRLTAERWPAEARPRARMALHTGAAEERAGDYFGPHVNRVARLLDAGHGGQVLVSEVTAALVRDALPERATLRSLGEHRLRDLTRRERIFQLLHPDLPVEFPPLRSLDSFPNNLPRQLTGFIGRERELAEVKRLLTATGLLTLTGVGGAGKTRLALQVAADVLETYPDGVWLVELAALGEPSLVPQAVASALGLQEDPRRPLVETLAGYLEPRSLLLILDNCEHLVAACAELASTLLRACPKLRILATSREALNVTAETTWRVPSLAVPDAERLPPAEDVARYEAVRLFIERAVAVRPEFALTGPHATAVVQVCRRLDGIPLAIELAAARVKVLSPAQIAARLDDRFQLLTTGGRTDLPRQQTLQALVDWSYDLLSEQEQRFLRRLAVFAGSWTLDAAEDVCEGGGIARYEILDLLENLIDKSLVQVDEQGDEARYRTLETIRQYGLGKLRQSGEEPALRARHRDWFLALVERAERELKGPEQATWIRELARELDNIRTALDWCRTQAAGGSEERNSAGADAGAEAGLRLCSALGFFWVLRGHLREGREWLTALLALGSERTVTRAKALATAGWLAHFQGDRPAARALLEEGLGIGRELADTAAVARALQLLGLVAYAETEYERAKALLGESLELGRGSGDRVGTYGVLENLGEVAWAEREYDRAAALHEEALTLKRAQGDAHGIAYSLRCLGDVARVRDRFEQATALYSESLALVRDLEDRLCVCRAIDGLALAASSQGRAERAARLFGVAEATRETVGFALPADRRAEYDRGVAAARSALADDLFAAAWGEGRAMSADEAIAYALRAPDEGAGVGRD